MPSAVNVHLLPSLIAPEALADSTVVVIDVLRATTTIVHAMAAQAREIIPCLEVDEARRMAANRLNSDTVLGGERDGEPIDGFDLGNSPAEYSAYAVAGKTIVFTTTNGTKAMRQCHLASRVLIGAFVNLSAVCQAISTDMELDTRIDLLCAGTRGEITREDALLAGAIVNELAHDTRFDIQLNDQAAMVRDAWRVVTADGCRSSSLAKTLRDSRGGRNLSKIGQQADIAVAAEIDRFAIVPVLDTQQGTIRLP